MNFLIIKILNFNKQNPNVMKVSYLKKTKRIRLCKILDNLSSIHNKTKTIKNYIPN